MCRPVYLMVSIVLAVYSEKELIIIVHGDAATVW